MANPNIYKSDVKLEVVIPLRIAAKRATYRREMHPEMTDAEVAAYLIEDSIIRLGMFAEEDRAREEGRAPGGGWRK